MIELRPPEEGYPACSHTGKLMRKLKSKGLTKKHWLVVILIVLVVVAAVVLAPEGCFDYVFPPADRR